MPRAFYCLILGSGNGYLCPAYNGFVEKASFLAPIDTPLVHLSPQARWLCSDNTSPCVCVWARAHVSPVQFLVNILPRPQLQILIAQRRHKKNNDARVSTTRPSRAGQNHIFKDRKLGGIVHEVAEKVLPDLARVQALEHQYPHTTYRTYYPPDAPTKCVCCQQRFHPDGTLDEKGRLLALILSEHFNPQHEILCNFDPRLVTPTLGSSTQYLLAVDVKKVDRLGSLERRPGAEKGASRRSTAQ